jgi:hypothetical protein
MVKQTRKFVKKTLYDEIAPVICYFTLWAYFALPILGFMSGMLPSASWAAVGDVAL